MYHNLVFHILKISPPKLGGVRGGLNRLCEYGLNRLSLRHLYHIIERVQDLLIVRLLALGRHLLNLDPAYAVERDRLLELLLGQLLTLCVLRNEVDTDTVDLVH